jgi:PAS domain S-box-containing protein
MSAEVERRVEALAELNRDLEERVRERTRELSSQHHLQRLILESIADGVVVADAEGHFLLWNGKAEQIIGSGPEKVPPERWAGHFGIFRDESGELLATEELPLVRAIRGESTVNAELYLRHPGRTEGHWIQVTARPLRDAQGQISGAVAVLVDVTEQKRLQSHVQGHRAELVKFGRLVLGAEIASTAAHQLSQPIAAMCNYAGAAIRLHEQGRLGERELGRVLARIESLSAESGKILDKLRARIRRRERLKTDVDVNAVMASSLEFLRERIERQGVKVECGYGTALPAIVGDAIELEHAVIQLGSNALDALEGTAQKERRLWIRTTHDPGAGCVRIEIRDTGPGVGAGIAGRMFDPWETEKPGALGIGLSIAQTIVESFGGRIKMERAAPRGALFRIDLPASVEERA